MRQFFDRIKGRAAGPTSQNPTGSSSSSPSSPAKIFPSGIKLLYNPADAAVQCAVDIVFIHGLTGDREKTWTAPGLSEPWPKALLPSKIPNARVLTFGYDAYVTDWRSMVSQSRIANHAWSLLTSLASFRENDDTNERSIIFICHSLGGLVCEDALCTSKQRTEPHLQSILRSTRGIVFLGTPHHGSGLARWAERLSRSIGVIKQTNNRIVDVLKRDSEVLARIQDGFHTMLMARGREGKPIEISCFFEELPIPGIGQVVPQNSAILPGYIPIGIHGNHMDMTKFPVLDDPGFMAVCGELRRWIKQLANVVTPGENPQHPRPSNDATFLVPYSCNPDFVGRSHILEQLKSQLGHAQAQTYSTHHLRAALYGLGGIGKTQIALAYVYWLQETRPDVSVFWVYASKVERFRESYALIGQECRIPGYDDPKTDVLQLVRQYLEKKENGRWLMVIDNADDTQLFGKPGVLMHDIPECSHGSVLITTRNKEAGSRLGQGRRPIEVGKMDESESNALLAKKLEEDETGLDNASVLSSRLEYLPLALVQAAAFIQEKSVSVGKYLELLDKSDHDLVGLLSEEFETVGRDSEASRAVTETWILSFEQIQRQDSFAGDLLSLMSFFERQAIPWELLLHYGRQQPEAKGELLLVKAIGVLKAFSFVAENTDHGLDVHRLVQLVTRKWLANKVMIDQLSEQALLTLLHAYPLARFENWTKCRNYLPHVHAALSYEGTVSRDGKVAKASLFHRTARFFHGQYQWEDAKKCLLRAAELRKDVLGLTHVDTINSVTNLVSTCWNQGQFREAEDFNKQVIEMRKSALGPEHQSVLTSMADLASIYMTVGRLEEAEKLSLQVMEMSLRVLGLDHPDTLRSMLDVASAYRYQCRWKEAEQLYKQVMETGSKVLGLEHLSTLVGMANLACTLRDQGLWKEAEELGLQVMDLSLRLLGSEHLDTLTSITALASTFWKQGKWEEAETLFLQVMETKSRVLGPDSPSTLHSMSNLAMTYGKQSKWEEAEKLLLHVMVWYNLHLGTHHPVCLDRMADLAWIYTAQGRSKEAEELELQIVNCRMSLLGPEHPSTVNSISNLASTYKDQGRLEEAEKLGKRVAKTERSAPELWGIDTLMSLDRLTGAWIY